MVRVRLTLEPDGDTCLESPFDRAFVDGLKAAIDYGGRAWDPQRKRWIISALYTDLLLQFLHQQGCQIQDDRAPASLLVPPPPMPEDLRQAFDALFLAYRAPLCVAEASYRALAKAWHPDKGGNPEDFHGVNDAIVTIRRYLDPKPDDTFEDSDIPF